MIRQPCVIGADAITDLPVRRHLTRVISGQG